jgi:DNA-binding NarL/FixJ family response regulator
MITKLRIFLAEDHVMVRTGLKSLINAETDMEVIGEATDGQTALKKSIDLKPDVVVMDISLPQLSGTQATQQLKSTCPNIRVVALTVHEDKSYLRELLEAGASGYVLKRAAAEDLIRAIRLVAGGRVYLDPHLAGTIVGTLVRKRSTKQLLQGNELSDRETEVLRLIAKGHSNKEIASQLNLSVKTIETYKTRSMDKVGLRSRTDIVRYAYHQGWLQNI